MNTRFVLPVVAVMLLSSCMITAVQGSGNVVSETREVSNFEQVEVCCGMRLLLTQGEQTQLTLEADDNILPDVETMVRGNTLIVRFRPNIGSLSVRLSHPVTVHLQMETIHGVGVSGGGSLEVETLETDRVALEFSGGSRGTIGELQAASVNLLTTGGGQTTIDHVDVDTFTLEISGGGRVIIDDGTVTNQRVVASGGSRYHASAVESERTTLAVSGGGEARVWVTEMLRVQASGGSNVEYTGNPSIDQQLSGGSALRASNR